MHLRAGRTWQRGKKIAVFFDSIRYVAHHEYQVSRMLAERGPVPGGGVETTGRVPLPAA
ncbi:MULTISPECIES: hypothetical protein [unclassified Frankia]|uniref:hypothetical protein n=1 Tax=unclassified Frankia TaxID=2632575 RepID=UPI001EF48E50|nr:MULTISPECIES: hypothetical protein [unclassified Frankia]